MASSSENTNTFRVNSVYVNGNYQSRPNSSSLPEPQGTLYSKGEKQTNPPDIQEINPQSHHTNGNGKSASGGEHRYQPAGEYFEPWLPLPLENWAMASLIVLMCLGCILMEVLLWLSNHDQGWPTLSQQANFGAVHYLYTVPSTALSLPVVAMWKWVDASIKKLQPYIDLSNGHATAEKTLFLDYNGTIPWVVWIQTIRNEHYIATLSTFLSLFALVISPLSSSLFVVRVNSENASRLWVTPVTAHILAAAFAILAIGGTVLAVAHNKARANLRLAHEPGSIASAASIAGSTEVAVILEGTDDERTMRMMLDQHLYKLDEKTGKIVFDGEQGFGPTSPPPQTIEFQEKSPVASPIKSTFAKVVGKKPKIEDPEHQRRFEEERQARLARLPERKNTAGSEIV